MKLEYDDRGRLTVASLRDVTRYERATSGPAEPVFTFAPRTTIHPLWRVKKPPLSKRQVRLRKIAVSKAGGFMRRHKIARPACPCGATKTQMHHVDYDVPLLVGFLCAEHHRDEHQGKLTFPFDVLHLLDMVES